ncbi:hypothetical protein F5Y13DRAFT_185360 [Hypoxylon sp. FL1857]|nr:hypothetical protein F5Y13DRAFT_185360 [Hypoxylon sp. FL1857]
MKCTLATLLPLFLVAATSVCGVAVPSITPSPGSQLMTCGGGLDNPCQDLCFCSGDMVNCHADPTSRCIQMCHC